MHVWYIIAAALTWAVVVSAQAAQSSPPTMVMPIPGVPLSVQASPDPALFVIPSDHHIREFDPVQ